ncbi:bifunctional folylpolyglutamate synthase/dihydrofolate synthase [bacterium]|nr:bifunctional folylpolyglutamate synthase/dihydrofolate synthase [candidate division CSSED10-310 bacterium]
MTCWKTIESMNEAVQFLYRFINYEKIPEISYTPEHYDLDAFRGFLNILGSPHRALQAIHIAGTKGKGSTAAIITSILHSCGYSTGLYTSPHLTNIRERIRVDCRAVSEDKFIELVNRVGSAWAADFSHAPGYRTTFEWLTAMAFDCFRRLEVKWSVLEVGMGGRLDCTNVVTPGLCIITPISLDHTGSLGVTLTQIAGEKAGILKPGIPAVVGTQTEEVFEVLHRAAGEKNTPVIRVKDRVDCRIQSMTLSQSVISVRMGSRRIDDLRIPLPGPVQIDNTATALAALDELGRRNLVEFRDDEIREGLERLHWPGRLSRIDFKSPAGWKVWVDGAHNPAAAERLSESIRVLCEGCRVWMVVGIPSNKDAESIMKKLAPAADVLIVTQYRSPRAMPVEQLQSIASRYHRAVAAAPDLASALETAFESLDSNGIVLVTGSLYLAGEVYELAGIPGATLDIRRDRT